MEIRIILEALKRFGVRGVFRITSAISWFIYPFLVWIGIYWSLGQNYFVLSWPALFGLGISTVFILLLLFQFVTLATLDRKLMKRIEHAKDVFSDPADSDSERRFRSECQRFMTPYLHFTAFTQSGFSGFFRAPSHRRKKVIIQIIFTLFFSYSIMAFLISNQTYFSQVYSRIVPPIPILYPILNRFFGFAAEYLVISIVLLFILSLYYDPSLEVTRKPYLKISKSLALSDFSICSISVFNRIFLLAFYAITAPLRLKSRENYLEYAPFGYPMDLSLLIQNAVLGAEGKRCVTSTLAYVPKDKNDIDNLMNGILQLEELPPIVKLFVRRSNPGETLEIVRSKEPILYLGTVDERCAVLGKVEYDPDKRIRAAKLFFDNRNVKDEFKKIVDIEINNQRKLKRRLPASLEEMITKIEGENKNGSRD